MNCDGVVTCREIIISSAGVAKVALTIYIIIWCTSAIVILEVYCSSGSEIDIEFIQVIIISHIRWFNIDLVMTLMGVRGMYVNLSCYNCECEKLSTNNQ